MTQKHDRRIAERVGRAEHGVHQGSANPFALVLGKHAYWAEAEYFVVLNGTDGAHDMANDQARIVFGNQR